jgi:hypothetical protein
MTDAEALSRLLDGDLSSAEEQALRARLAAEPDLARLHAQMQAWILDLEALPDEEQVPAELLQAARAQTTASRASETPSSTRRGAPRWLALLGGAGWAAAAATALVWIGTAALAPSHGPATASAAPLVTLAEGRQRVVGHGVMLRAGDARMQVDGEVWITVEPAGRPLRRHGQEDPMDHTHALAALGGAAITVAVITGSAMLWPGDNADAAPVLIPAGTTHRIGAPRAADDPLDRSPDVPLASLEGLDAAVARQLGQLQEDNERLRFENELLSGQLSLARGGDPVPFPHDLAEAFTPEGFAARVAEIAQATPGIQHLRDDCSEYPCLSVLDVDPTLDAAALKATLGRVGDSLGEGLGDPQTFMSVAKYEEDGGDESTTAIVWMLPEQTSPEETRSMKERLAQRIRTLEDEHRADLAAGD